MEGCTATPEMWTMCIKLSTHHLVDGAIEGIVLCKDEQNNEGHVDMMRISVLHMVKDLEDGQDLRGREGEREGRGWACA